MQEGREGRRHRSPADTDSRAGSPWGKPALPPKGESSAPNIPLRWDSPRLARGTFVHHQVLSLLFLSPHTGDSLPTYASKYSVSSDLA